MRGENEANTDTDTVSDMNSDRNSIHSVLKRVSFVVGAMHECVAWWLCANEADSE